MHYNCVKLKNGRGHSPTSIPNSGVARFWQALVHSFIGGPPTKKITKNLR